MIIWRTVVAIAAIWFAIVGFVGGMAARRYVAEQSALAQIHRYAGCMALAKFAYVAKPLERDGRERLIRLFGMQADCMKAAGIPSISLAEAEAIARRY